MTTDNTNTQASNNKTIGLFAHPVTNKLCQLYCPVCDEWIERREQMERHDAHFKQVTWISEGKS